MNTTSTSAWNQNARQYRHEKKSRGCQDEFGLIAKQQYADPVSFLRALFASTPEGRDLLEKCHVMRQQSAFRRPSQEEVDSYDKDVVRALRDSNIPKLRERFLSGRTMNACNLFGESLLHMACRRGDLDVVRFLIREAQCRIDITDDYGRTPLHDACWTPQPNLSVVEELMSFADPLLWLRQDVRGHTPFEYARRDHREIWMEFLHQKQSMLLEKVDSKVEIVDDQPTQLVG
jgi:hypothetical protein